MTSKMRMSLSVPDRQSEVNFSLIIILIATDFDQETVVNSFTPSMKLEAVEMMAPQLICVTSIAQVINCLICVHLDD